MPDWGKRLELLTNIAVIGVCGLLAYVLIARFVMRPESHEAGRQIPAGQNLIVSGVNWGSKSQNLVLVLSTKCRFCTESADFYRSLIPALQEKGVQVVGVFPQTTMESQRYLAELHIPLQEVRQAHLDSLQISATPTLLVVNRDGVVTSGWVGKLSPSQQKEVLSHF